LASSHFERIFSAGFMPSFSAAHRCDTRISLTSRFLSLSHSHTSFALSLSLFCSVFSSSQETNEHTARVAHHALAHERSLRRQQTLARFHWLDGNSSNNNSIGSSTNNSSIVGGSTSMDGNSKGGGSADNVSIALVASTAAAGGGESARTATTAIEARICFFLRSTPVQQMHCHRIHRFFGG
jgi:hypothetical protein